MITLFIKELNEFLNSLTAYIAVGIFLTGIGLIMWFFPETNVLEYGYASLEPVFTLGPYVFLFLIPAITMRSFAEENRAGTMELLFTLPFHSWQIIMGKFLAAWTLVLFALIPTFIYYGSIYYLGSPVGNIDTSGILGSYLGLWLLGGVFASIGIFTSAINENQIVSFILAAFFCFVLYEGISMIASFEMLGTWDYYIEQFAVSSHYQTMGLGLLNLRDVTYFVGFIIVFLTATNVVIQFKK